LGQRTVRTLAMLRTTLFACGAILGADGRQPLLRLSRARPSLAGHVPRVPSEPVPDDAQLQCSCCDRG
jgi:hypothetical protein